MKHETNQLMQLLKNNNSEQILQTEPTVRRRGNMTSFQTTADLLSRFFPRV